jgi:hypothetical protein
VGCNTKFFVAKGNSGAHNVMRVRNGRELILRKDETTVEEETFF